MSSSPMRILFFVFKQLGLLPVLLLASLEAQDPSSAIVPVEDARQAEAEGQPNGKDAPKADKFFSVLGAVNRPGQFPFPLNAKIDLPTAIALAGGVNAKPTRITIHSADNRARVLGADRKPEDEAKVMIKPGNRIVVLQRAVFQGVTVMGQVHKPGPFALPAKGGMNLGQAIAVAGGLKPLANPQKVAIQRDGKVFAVDLRKAGKGGRNFLLKADDIIIVPERRF